MEALIGAIYLDAGYERTREAVLDWFGPRFELVVEGARPDNVKSALQEVLQAKGDRAPHYRVVAEEGPDHAKIFEVEISVEGKPLASGRGRSKKEAEKNAARRALEVLEEQDEND